MWRGQSILAIVVWVLLVLVLDDVDVRKHGRAHERSRRELSTASDGDDLDPLAVLAVDSCLLVVGDLSLLTCPQGRVLGPWFGRVSFGSNNACT